jgi:uncharacterized SAM-binding protein YcdF (DUF218 family)
MFVFLSKFLPLFVYPAGLITILLILAIVFHRRKRVWVSLIVVSLVILFVGGNRWVSTSLVKSIEWQYLPPAEVPHADVIVVLGGGTDANVYPRQMPEVNGAGDRVLYAAKLYKEGKADHILVSGGNITWLNGQSTSPAEDMTEILELMGVPADAIWQQGKSQNTYEDALYSSQILKEKGASTVLLVTSAIHMPRAAALFRKQGIEFTPMPTDYSVSEAEWDDLVKGSFPAQVINLVPSATYIKMTTTALKEKIGLVVYEMEGWTDNGD